MEQEGKSEEETEPKIEQVELKKVEHYIEIWKFFCQRKEELQQRLYSFITWSVGALIGFVTFALQEWCSLMESFIYWTEIFTLIIAVWVGVVTFFAIKIDKHKTENEERQIRAAKKIIGLKEEIIDK